MIRLAIQVQIAFMLLITGLAYGGEVKIMPKELLEFAHENYCEQVSDYYDADSGPTRPPFAYGYLPGNEENSAVFWCRKKMKDDTGASKYKYILLFAFKRVHELAKCPRIVEWPFDSYYPGGLSIISDSKETLDDFFYLNDPNNKPPKGIHLKYPAILSSRNGSDETFYCHNGRWLVRMRDRM